MPIFKLIAFSGSNIGIGGVGVVIGLVIGVVAIGWFAVRTITGGTIRLARRDAKQIVDAANTEGESLKSKIELESERDATKRKKELEQEVHEAQQVNQKRCWENRKARR